MSFIFALQTPGPTILHSNQIPSPSSSQLPLHLSRAVSTVPSSPSLPELIAPSPLTRRAPPQAHMIPWSCSFLRRALVHEGHVGRKLVWDRRRCCSVLPLIKCHDWGQLVRCYFLQTPTIRTSSSTNASPQCEPFIAF